MESSSLHISRRHFVFAVQNVLFPVIVKQETGSRMTRDHFYYYFFSPVTLFHAQITFIHGAVCTRVFN